MTIRLILGAMYLATALLLADWGLRMEIEYEISSQHIPFMLYALFFGSLGLGLAAILLMLRQRLATWIGLVACVMALPMCTLSLISGRWGFILRDVSELVQKIASVMVVVHPSRTGQGS